MNLQIILDSIGTLLNKYWALMIIVLLILYTGLIINKITLRFLKTHLQPIFSSVKRKDLVFSVSVQGLLACLLVVRFTFNQSNISMLLTVSSIFCALLLNLLILVYDLFQKIQERISKEDSGNINVTLSNIHKSLEELYRNIGLLIFESILIIVMSAPFMLGFSNAIGVFILSFLLLFMSLVFIKQLFETIKQVFNLIIITL